MNPMSDHSVPHLRLAQSRRDFLFQAGGGFGGLALSWLLARDGCAAAGPARVTASTNPLAARQPHFRPRANSVIFMYMVGGPSPIDLFDPKPALHTPPGEP